jgi:hypothetical protein
MSSMNLTPMPFVDVIIIITLTITIPCKGCYFMNMWAWAWIGGHEQRSKTKSFLEFFSHIDGIFKIHFVTPRTWYLVTWKNILPRVMDEWYLWMKMWTKMTMDELFHEHSQQDTFQTKYKKIMLVYCEKFNTWNAQVTLELVFQIPWLLSIF